MAWNEPGNKDPWGRNKNNSSLDGVFKDFKKTIDDLLGSGSSLPPSSKKSACLLYTSPSPRDSSPSRMPSSA